LLGFLSGIDLYGKEHFEHRTIVNNSLLHAIAPTQMELRQ